MSELVAIPATTRAHAERIRLMRNATLGKYSTNNEAITWYGQLQWWERTDGKRLAWLYHEQGSDELIGFGMLLRNDDDGLWRTTVVVLPEYPGCGHGRAITHHIVTHSPGQCLGSARHDNPAAVRVHAAAEWDPIEGPDERLAYFLTKPGVTA